MRRNRDLQAALEKREKVETKLREKQARQLLQKHMEEKISTNIKSMQRNPIRAISSTRSAASSAISKEQLDNMAAQRIAIHAHGAAMPLSARDLSVGGLRLGVPAWVKGAGM